MPSTLRHLRFGRDWAPVVVLLVLYNLSCGFAGNHTTLHTTELIAVDRWLFGGTVPTVWLQQHLYDPAGVHRVRRRWWPVLLLYPLVMAAALVYSGEHYVVDVLVGWSYVVVVLVVVGLAERCSWSTRSSTRSASRAERDASARSAARA